MNPLVSAGTSTSDGMTALSVNVNKIALLRNQRQLGLPSVVKLAQIALEAGAHGITIHPRPDERHIRASDARELAAMMKAWPNAEFNIEGNPFHNLMPLVRELRPHQCTFVPDAEGQVTSDHGFNLAREGARLEPLIAEARSLGVRVSLFVDADSAAMPLARRAGADRVELYTEPFASTHGTDGGAGVLEAFTAAARAAASEGLGVNAGHDLNRSNLTDFLVAVRGVREVSIGHALIADALEFGMTETVREYLRCITRAAGGARR